MKIPFNKPYLSGKELEYIGDAIHRGKLSGDGHYTKKCDYFLGKHTPLKKSCSPQAVPMRWKWAPFY